MKLSRPLTIARCKVETSRPTSLAAADKSSIVMHCPRSCRAMRRMHCPGGLGATAGTVRLRAAGGTGGHANHLDCTSFNLRAKRAGLVPAARKKPPGRAPCDNLNTHKPKHDRWLAHKNVHFHFTPTHASSRAGRLI